MFGIVAMFGISTAELAIVLGVVFVGFLASLAVVAVLIMRKK